MTYELPPEPSTSEGRKAWLEKAMRELADEQAAQAADEDPVDGEPGEDPVFQFERSEELVGASNQGRRGWLREGHRQLEQHRSQHPRPVPRSRRGRLLEGLRQLDDELDAERQAKEYEAWRLRRIAADGSRRMAPGTTKPYQPPQLPAGKINVTDPDSRLLKAMKGYVQGYNAQLVTTQDQIVIAAEGQRRLARLRAPRTDDHRRPGRARGCRREREAGDDAS